MRLCFTWTKRASPHRVEGASTLPLVLMGMALVKRLRLMRLRLGTVVLGVVAGSAPTTHAIHGNQAFASSP